MDIQPISVKQLRQSFPYFRTQLQKGTRYLLIYRSKPIAEIQPVTKPIPEISKFVDQWLSLTDKFDIQTPKSAVELIQDERK